MKKRRNKKWIIVLIAIVTAIVGALVAVGAYLKKKASALGETLDYDADFYDDEDDFYDEENFDNLEQENEEEENDSDKYIEVIDEEDDDESSNVEEIVDDEIVGDFNKIDEK